MLFGDIPLLTGSLQTLFVGVVRGRVRYHFPIHCVGKPGRVASIRLGSRSADIAKTLRCGIEEAESLHLLFAFD